MIPGHDLHEEALQILKVVSHLVSSEARKAAIVDAQSCPFSPRLAQPAGSARTGPVRLRPGPASHSPAPESVFGFGLDRLGFLETSGGFCQSNHPCG